MMSNDVPFSSPTYPYKRVLPGTNLFRGAELVPYKILYYLLDLPDSNGYQPVDDNERPRVRLAKLLWNDGPRPLDGPLPTPQEKLSMLFSGEEPDINTDEQKKRHPKGYRLYPQRNIAQSGIQANTILKIYPGRILDDTDFRSVIGFQAEIWSDPNLTNNTKTTARDRVFDIETCLRDALSNIDLAGAGPIKFARQYSSFNGSENLYSDSGENGRILYFSIVWSESGKDKIKAY